MLRKMGKIIIMAEKYPVVIQLLIFCILYKMCKEKPSHPGYKMITWFVTDRTESVNTFSDVYFLCHNIHSSIVIFVYELHDKEDSCVFIFYMHRVCLEHKP